MDKKYLYKIEFESEEKGVEYCLKKGVVEKEIRKYKLSDVIPFSSRLKGSDGAVLSNMYNCRLEWKGMVFNSAEQLIYYVRCEGNDELRKEIMRCKNSFEVKNLSKKHKGKQEIKNRFTSLYVAQSVKYEQCKEFRDILVKSGEKPLVEYAEWGDVINGCCKYGEDGLIGQNACGRIMMKVREDMRNKI